MSFGEMWVFVVMKIYIGDWGFIWRSIYRVLRFLRFVNDVVGEFVCGLDGWDGFFEE